MKLVGIIRSLVLEYIHDDATKIFHENIDGVDVEIWKSPHTEELRGDKKRIPEQRVFEKLLKETIEEIVKKYFKSGKQFKLIDKDDPKKLRFAVRKIKGESRPQMILQIEELTEDRILLNIISFIDTGNDFFGINNPNKARFILDLGEKDLVGK
jgi:hypothetical protein